MDIATASVCVYSWFKNVLSWWLLCRSCNASSGRLPAALNPASAERLRWIEWWVDNSSFRMLFMTLMSVCVSSEVKTRIFSKCCNVVVHENLIFYAGKETSVADQRYIMPVTRNYTHTLHQAVNTAKIMEGYRMRWFRYFSRHGWAATFSPWSRSSPSSRRQRQRVGSPARPGRGPPPLPALPTWLRPHPTYGAGGYCRKDTTKMDTKNFKRRRNCIWNKFLPYSSLYPFLIFYPRNSFKCSYLLAFSHHLS